MESGRRCAWGRSRASRRRLNPDRFPLTRGGAWSPQTFSCGLLLSWPDPRHHSQHLAESSLNRKASARRASQRPAAKPRCQDISRKCFARCVQPKPKFGESPSISLPRRPAEIASAEQMQMQMKDGLARPGTVIQDRAVACEELALARKLRRHQLQLAKYRLVFGHRVGQRFKMFARTK